jgi:hypothetical protein
MALRPFTWLPHNGKRHAIKADLVAHDDTTTLCGEELTVPGVRPTKDDWCRPTCPQCDAAWRAAEGIPVFPRQRSPQVNRQRQ